MTNANSQSANFPRSWYPLCRSVELPVGRIIRREAFGQSVAVFRTASGKIGAMTAQCVHMGADLGRGKIIGERLQCPLHHWEYAIGGQCERIPGVDSIPPQAWQATFTCHEQYGLVFAFLGGTPTFEFPLFAASDHDLFSSAFVMDFETPYQVLAANSFDGQHFSSVHHRELLAAPTLTREGQHHFGVEFKARVSGTEFHDRLLRWVGVNIVELSAHCWGGNTILAYNARTQARILFTILPITANQTRVFIVNVIATRTAAKLPRPIRLIALAMSHQLTIAFLKADIAVMRDLQFKLGVLLPEADHVFIEWIKYWKSLPLAVG